MSFWVISMMASLKKVCPKKLSESNFGHKALNFIFFLELAGHNQTNIALCPNWT